MRTPISFRISRVALCVALALGAVPVLAQNTTSAVAGKVTGRDGKAIASATVTVRHVESGFVSNLTTDAEGRYLAAGPAAWAGRTRSPRPRTAWGPRRATACSSSSLKQIRSTSSSATA